MKSIASSVLLCSALSFTGIHLSHASGLVTDAASEPMFWECNACTIEGVEATASLHGSGIHFVYDLPGKKLYRALCEPGGGATINCMANRMTSGTAYTSFLNYHALWINNFQSEAFHEALQANLTSFAGQNPGNQPTDDHYINAFDTLTSSNSGYYVNQFLQQTLGTKVGIIEPHVDGVDYDYENGTLTVTVTFHDHSTRQYKLTKQSGGNYIPVPNTARDSSHNPLPETPPTGYQNYSFYDSPHGYNPTNMILLLQPPALPDSQGGCETIRWNGVGVTCVHPY
jgi:hypothetical protein